ncbi:MAG TPA: sigma 54-interacting transcriptional regulator [Polyangiaceae bacterium]|nr:sigma 54-interacting transcriptional regulator [Polyangiaceae bacterium]
MTDQKGKKADDLSTIMSPMRQLPPEKLASFVVQVVEGPDTGASLTIDGSQPSRALVGKSAICQLCLKDPKVSRRHLALDIAGDALRLTDLGSTNGTLVSGVRFVEVLVDGQAELIRLGDSVLRVTRLAPSLVAVPAVDSFGRVIGASPEMRRLYPLCERLAASDVPLVIEGETGTGKELLAESLHERSARASGPFVVFDCTAVPANLIEATLFGHERGAFTGAIAANKGLFQEANGGTLLIDEVGDLDVALQPKLLRAIERAEVRPLGGSRWISVDVRVMAATRRDLDKEIQAGRFRDDLFYRLAVARIELPPLRQRRGDIALLARHFWERLGGDGPLPYDLLVRLENHDWPGNIRELHNAVARRLALGDLAHAPLEVRQGSATAGSHPPPPNALLPGDDVIARVIKLGLPLSRSRELVVDDFERRYVQAVLDRHQGDATRAAQASGIARRYFQLLRARQAGRTGG